MTRPTEQEEIPVGHLTAGQVHATRPDQQPYADESAEFKQMLEQRRQENKSLIESLDAEAGMHEQHAIARRTRILKLFDVQDAINLALSHFDVKPTQPNLSSYYETIQTQIEHKDEDKE